MPNNIVDELLPLFKCEPVLCDHEPPSGPDPGCGVIDPGDIHTCSSKQFPIEGKVVNQPGLADNEMKQYETTVNYTCPSSNVKQFDIDYLKNNFTFEITGATTPSTYIQDLQAFCEIDK